MHTAHPFHSANPQPSTKDLDRRTPRNQRNLTKNHGKTEKNS